MWANCWYSKDETAPLQEQENTNPARGLRLAVGPWSGSLTSYLYILICKVEKIIVAPSEGLWED